MNGDLILIIPILLIIVAIMFLVRHLRGGSDDSIAALIGIVPIVIVIGVAIGIIVSMASIADPWEWDADSKTLTIDGNIHDTGLSYPWTGYANQVETLVIEPGVEFVQGPAFARMTNLEYVDIAEGVTLDDGAFSQTFKDPFDADIAMTDVAGHDYVGFEGVFYEMADESMFIVGTLDGKPTISGFSETAGTVLNLVVPKSVNGQVIKSIRYSAFTGSAIETLLFAPDSEIEKLDTSCFYQCSSLAKADTPQTLTTISSGAFNECAALETIVLHEGVTALPYYSFRQCSSLASLTIPSTVREIGAGAFLDCTSLESLTFPEGLQILSYNGFSGCAALETVTFPSTITSIGATVFGGCTGITSVTFANDFAPGSLASNWCPWTFFASDVDTVIDKTVAANLAGKTFFGTAAALVEVVPGDKSLTPDQLQKVHLHDAEIERIRLEAISIDPLPFELQDA